VARLIYDEAFQRQLIGLALRHPHFLEQYPDLIQPEYFEVPSYGHLARLLLGFHAKYHRPPVGDTVKLLAKEYVATAKLPPTFEEEILRALGAASVVDISNAEWYIEHAVAFAKRQKARGFILDWAKKLEGSSDDIDLEEWERGSSDVRAVGAPRDTGVLFKDVLGDLPERLQKSKQFSSAGRIETGVGYLDKTMGGGLGVGEVGVVSGGTGKGKSMVLTSFGTHGLRMGEEVIHVSLELKVDEAVLRYASNATRVPQDQIINGGTKYQDAIRAWQAKPNNLLVKYFSPYSITLEGLWGYIGRLISQTNMHPRLLILDYADLLLTGSGSKSFNSAEQAAALGKTYHKLRAMGDEFGFAVWTASQIQRGAYDAVQADTHVDGNDVPFRQRPRL